YRREVQALRCPLPPMPRSAPLRKRREGVLIEDGAYVLRGTVREGIPGEQRRDVLRAFEQAQHEAEKPRILLVAAECREPHLPIEPRLVWLDERRRPRRITGLPFELVRTPSAPIVAAFDDDLGSARRHHGEKAI